MTADGVVTFVVEIVLLAVLVMDDVVGGVVVVVGVMSLSASAFGVFSGTGRLTFVVAVGVVVVVVVVAVVESVAAAVVVVVVLAVASAVVVEAKVVLIADFCFSVLSLFVAAGETVTVFLAGVSV